MQIATLNYQYKPKENVIGDSRAKLCHRHVLTTITNTQKKPKQRQSLHAKLNGHSGGALPPIKNGSRRNSMRIKGSSLTSSSKIGDTSAYSFNHQSRSQSRQSNKSENLDGRNRSNSSGRIVRPTSQLNRMKFGYPIKLRSAEFYGPDKSESELRFREESFVNDSVRSAHQNRRSSIIPYYEALDDPHLRRFFQSPIVLDIVRKTLDIEPNNSSKHEERSGKLSKLTQRSKSNDLYDTRNDDYQRIVTKGSSGYAKLNGYDCIPSYSPARHDYHHSNMMDPTTSSSQRWNRTGSRLNQSTTQDKQQASANTSLTSFPTSSSNPLQNQQRKKKIHRYEKSKQPKPLATSSPLRHPVRQLVESTMSIIDASSTTKVNDNVSEQKNDFAVASTVSQD